MSNMSMAHVAPDTERYRKHTISLLVANRPGVLIRISLVFARRGYNIDSLVVSPASDPDFYMMNIMASGDERTLDQILKQLNKLIDVVHASDRTGENIIQRELALIKIACTSEERGELLQLAHALKCDTIDLDDTSLTVQITGTSERLDSAISVLRTYSVMELVRTGKVLMARGSEMTA